MTIRILTVCAVFVTAIVAAGCENGSTSRGGAAATTMYIPQYPSNNDED